ncbi:ATP-binding protein [Candidatus Woesearchaeota archaeon]|nr:ATP-binding protein [Candidatus Woesearchaeota archaeon]
MSLNFKSTADIKVPEKIIDQVVGQEAGVEVMRKAAQQRRHVLLIGDPGTGKSMMGLALAEMLSKEKLVDIVSFTNMHDENQPLIRTAPAGKGRDLVAKARIQSNALFRYQNWVLIALAVLAMFLPWWARSYYKSDIIFAAFFIGGMIFLASFVVFINLGKRMGGAKFDIPKVIVDNYGRKTAPFWDATGAHAGALLGDILHDPLQSFCPSEVVILENGKPSKRGFHWALDKCADKPFKVEQDGTEYTVAFVKNKVTTLGEKRGKTAPVDVLSFNTYNYDGKMIRLITSDKKEITVTPEHKVAVCKHGKVDYVEAQQLKPGDEVFSLKEDILLDEQDIISTYNKKQQEQCALYYAYLDNKEQNPLLGYKRLAKSIEQRYAKTRWWHAGKCIPVPVQTCNWLKERGLLPLRITHEKVPLMAKILGAMFGDGGIFQNLNGVFLSSSERFAVEEFGEDINSIFRTSGNERIIEGGEYGHSWCYQNTNRHIIRFLLALGAPQGNKTKIHLYVPQWIKFNPVWNSEFWGSFLGNELGVPKVHVSGRNLNTLDVGICGTHVFEQNRSEFLTELKQYLESKYVKAGKIAKSRNKETENYIYKLLISTTFENVANFASLIKINYCRYKQEKLIQTLNRFSEVKRERYAALVSRGYGAEHTMKLLQLTPASLYMILNHEKFDHLLEAQS